MAVRIKKTVFRLLKEDEEFRYAVAGLLGLEEILKRLDRHEAELVKLREDMMLGFKRHDEELASLREETSRLREETNRLREDMIAGFRRHDEEIAKLREDMMLGFRRHDEEFVRLREDMARGFELMNRHLNALGARWGIMAESAFREGLRGVLERELGLVVERWTAYDEDGYVYGYPSAVDIDVAVRDGKTILVEVKSHVRRSDVNEFRRKAEFYGLKTGKTAERKVIVTPYVEEEALEAAKQLEIEVYTKV
ncbi:MAG: DUF3782 domain-containing protein [Candidatus Caldarchaeum sp.]